MAALHFFRKQTFSLFGVMGCSVVHSIVSGKRAILTA